MATKQYLDYEGLQRFFEKLEERYAPIQALQFRGTVATISALPTVADEKPGYVYNITTGGTTTADFVDAEQGKVLQDGENVVVVNVGTDEDPELRYDVLGGLFNIEDRLQWGFTMPASPVDNQIFLYMGETSYVYSVATVDPDANPSELGLYEYDSATETYSLTADTAVESGKDYYTRAEDKVKGVIYKYNASGTEWVPQSSGDQFTRITEAQIDALFD